MISSEANVKKIVALIEDSKGWVELKSEKTRLDVTHKLVSIVGMLFFIIVLLLILMLVLACLSFAAAYSMGSKSAAFLCVSLFYVVLLIVAYATRSKWLFAPLGRLFSDLAPEELKKKSDSMQTDITAKESSLKKNWDSLVNEEEPVVLSPTKRVMNWITDSSNVIDGALLGWKLYRVFGKKKKFF